MVAFPVTTAAMHRRTHTCKRSAENPGKIEWETG